MLTPQGKSKNTDLLPYIRNIVINDPQKVFKQQPVVLIGLQCLRLQQSTQSMMALL